MNSLLWILGMAWRDCRASRWRLLLFASAIAAGVASIVLIESFSRNLSRVVNDQAKALLGADLMLQTRRGFDAEAEKLIEQFGGERAEETAFSTMIVFPESKKTRLIQLRAVEGDYPFYGEMKVEPPAARETLRIGPNAIVEETILLQFRAKVGDTIKLGEQEFRIAGKLLSMPGEAATFGTLSPRVLIPRTMLPSTGLLRPGAVSRQRIYLKLPDGTDADALVKSMHYQLDALRIRAETVNDRKEDMGESLANVRRYLHLATVTALLLGGLGVAGAVQAHIRPRLRSVAILRCLGASRMETFAIYVVQGIGIAMAGTAAGIVLGLALQGSLPALLREFLPAQLEFHAEPTAVAMAAGVGFVISVLFAVLPMLQTRLIPPISALRHALFRRPRLDWLSVVLVVALAGAFVLFLAQGAENWRQAFTLAACVAVAFAALLGASAFVRAIARRAVSSGPFVLRQGVSNLYRPGNRTLLVMIVLGLGTQLMLTMRLSEHVLVKDALFGNPDEQSNLILFDIQPDQLEAAKRVVLSAGMPVVQEAPLVTMRLVSVRGKRVEELLNDKSVKIPAWTLQREYRSSYRDHLVSTETLVKGEWIGTAPAEGSVPVSIEEGLARDLGVSVGDSIVFDVQGLEMPVRIASIRRVDWKRFQTNFFFVFPTGVLEEAPRFHVVVTRAPTSQASADLQSALVAALPNVSAFDLRLIVQTIREVVEKGRAAIEFMAGITLAAGLMVLLSASIVGKEQRDQEAAVLRAIGATRRNVQWIRISEDAMLGLCAAITGSALAIGTVWALAEWVFKAPFLFVWEPAAVTIGLVVLCTVVAGQMTAWSSRRKTPLEVLRG